MQIDTYKKAEKLVKKIERLDEILKDEDYRQLIHIGALENAVGKQCLEAFIKKRRYELKNDLEAL